MGTNGNRPACGNRRRSPHLKTGSSSPFQMVFQGWNGGLWITHELFRGTFQPFQHQTIWRILGRKQAVPMERRGQRFKPFQTYIFSRSVPLAPLESGTVERSHARGFLARQDGERATLTLRPSRLPQDCWCKGEGSSRRITGQRRSAANWEKQQSEALPIRHQAHRRAGRIDEKATHPALHNTNAGTGTKGGSDSRLDKLAFHCGVRVCRHFRHLRCPTINHRSDDNAVSNLLWSDRLQNGSRNANLRDPGQGIPKIPSEIDPGGRKIGISGIVRWVLFFARIFWRSENFGSGFLERCRRDLELAACAFVGLVRGLARPGVENESTGYLGASE